MTSFGSLLLAVTLPTIQIILLCSLGAFWARRGLLTYEGRKVLGGLTYNVFMPALTFTSLGASITPERLLQWWPLIMNLMISTGIGAALGLLNAMIVKPDAWFRPHTVCSVMFGNAGNLPLVIVSSLAHSSASILGGMDPNQASQLAIAYVVLGLVTPIVTQAAIGYKMLAKIPLEGREGPDEATKAGTPKAEGPVPDAKLVHEVVPLLECQITSTLPSVPKVISLTEGQVAPTQPHMQGDTPLLAGQVAPTQTRMQEETRLLAGEDASTQPQMRQGTAQLAGLGAPNPDCEIHVAAQGMPSAKLSFKPHFLTPSQHCISAGLNSDPQFPIPCQQCVPSNMVSPLAGSHPVSIPLSILNRPKGGSMSRLLAHELATCSITTTTTITTTATTTPSSLHLPSGLQSTPGDQGLIASPLMTTQYILGAQGTPYQQAGASTPNAYHPCTYPYGECHVGLKSPAHQQVGESTAGERVVGASQPGELHVGASTPDGDHPFAHPYGGHHVGVSQHPCHGSDDHEQHDSALGCPTFHKPVVDSLNLERVSRVSSHPLEVPTLEDGSAFHTRALGSPTSHTHDVDTLDLQSASLAFSNLLHAPTLEDSITSQEGLLGSPTSHTHDTDTLDLQSASLASSNLLHAPTPEDDIASQEGLLGSTPFLKRDVDIVDLQNDSLVSNNLLHAPTLEDGIAFGGMPLHCPTNLVDASLHGPGVQGSLQDLRLRNVASTSAWAGLYSSRDGGERYRSHDDGYSLHEEHRVHGYCPHDEKHAESCVSRDEHLSEGYASHDEHHAESYISHDEHDCDAHSVATSVTSCVHETERRALAFSRFTPEFVSHFDLAPMIRSRRHLSRAGEEGLGRPRAAASRRRSGLRKVSRREEGGFGPTWSFREPRVSGRAHVLMHSMGMRGQSALRAVLRELTSPPMLATLVGVLVGCIAPLQALLFSPDAKLAVIANTLRMLSACANPVILVGFGAALSNGPGAAYVPRRVIISVGICRLIILPLLGMAWVMGAYKLGLFCPPDPIFLLVLLTQNTVPTGFMVHTMSVVHQNGDKEVSSMLFWQYLVSIATIPPSLLIYLYITRDVFLNGAQPYSH